MLEVKWWKLDTPVISDVHLQSTPVNHCTSILTSSYNGGTENSPFLARCLAEVPSDPRLSAPAQQ